MIWGKSLTNNPLAFVKSKSIQTHSRAVFDAAAGLADEEEAAG